MLRRIDIEAAPQGLLIPFYLLASFCYYVLSQSPLTDDAFDYLCVRLLKEYDEVEHIHKHLVDRGSLEAGTCLLGLLAYPARVQNGAEGFLKMCQDRTHPILHLKQ